MFQCIKAHDVIVRCFSFHFVLWIAAGSYCTDSLMRLHSKGWYDFVPAKCQSENNNNHSSNSSRTPSQKISMTTKTVLSAAVAISWLVKLTVHMPPTRFRRFGPLQQRPQRVPFRSLFNNVGRAFAFVCACTKSQRIAYVYFQSYSYTRLVHRVCTLATTYKHMRNTNWHSYTKHNVHFSASVVSCRFFFCARCALCVCVCSYW